MLRDTNPKLSLIIRTIAIILLAAFFAQDIVWSYPELQSNNKLAVTGLQNPGTLYRLRASLIIGLVEKNLLQQDLAKVRLIDIQNLIEANAAHSALDGVELKCVYGNKKGIRELRLCFDSEGLIIRFFNPDYPAVEMIPQNYTDVTADILKTDSHDLDPSKKTHVQRQILRRTAANGTDRKEARPGLTKSEIHSVIADSVVPDRDERAKYSRSRPPAKSEEQNGLASAESVYKDYFETVFEFNIRLFVLLAQRMKAKRTKDLAEADRTKGEIDKCIAQINWEIAKFEKRLKEVQAEAQMIESHRLAKIQFARAEELIKQNNEPAANATLVGALNMISLARERILKKRIVAQRRTVRVDEEDHKIVMWQQVYTRKDKESKTLMPVYSKRTFDLSWLAGSSLDRQEEGNLEEHDKMAEYVRMVEKDQIAAETAPATLTAANVEQILAGLSGVQVEEKRLARIVFEAVKELVDMDETGSVKYLLPVAKRYLYLRVEDINNILFYIQTARAKPFRALVTKRNRGFMARVAAIKDMLNRLKYEEALGSTYGLLKTVKPYLAEPDLDGLDDMIWPVINELNALKKAAPKDSNTIKFRARLWLEKISNKLDESQFLNEFMEEFGTEYVRRRLDSSPVASREDTFIDVFDKFAKKKNLPRDEARTRAFQILCYMAVFISVEIDNPAKPSERIPNPVFKAIHALRLIVEVDHIKTITEIKRLKGFKATSELLKGVKAKFVHELSFEERKQLVRAIAKDTGLTDQQTFELAKAFAISRENLSKTYESVKGRPAPAEPLPNPEELARNIEKLVKERSIVTGKDGRQYILKPAMGETNDGWAMEIFIYPIEAIDDKDFIGSIRLTVIDAATIMIHNADIRDKTDRGQGIFTHVLDILSDASDDRVGLVLYKVEQIDTLVAATKLLPGRFVNEAIKLILERAEEKGIDTVKEFYRFFHDNLAEAMSKGAQVDAGALASTPLIRVLNKAGYDAKFVVEKAGKWSDTKYVVNIRAAKTRKAEGSPRSLGAAAADENVEKVKQQLANWHTEYMKLINESRQKWLEAHPGYDGRNMVKISLRLPKDTLQQLGRADISMTTDTAGGKITVVRGDDSHDASLDNRLDIRDFTQAEKIAILAGLPRLMPGEKSMENAAAKTRRYFSWWRESLKDFEVSVDWSTDFTAQPATDQLEVASIYLSQKDGTVYIEQFITNPGFRLTGIGGQFLRQALLELKGQGPVRLSTLRPAWFAEGAREFLQYLQKTGFIVGPFVDNQGEYWFLENEAPAAETETENPFLKASERLLQAMAPPAQDNPITKAFGRVGEAVEITMRSAGISQYCTYIPHMNEFGEYIFPEDTDKKSGLPHIQWVTSSAAGVAMKSRHISPRPLTGEKWIFERLARGELSGDDINAIAGEAARFDNALGIWHISDRRSLMKRLLADEHFKGSVTEEELAIIDRDYADIGPAANTITYQSIYAPTLKEKDRPRLLGIQWFMGDLTAFQAEAVKSFAFQAGYALERIYLLHSLEARKREIGSADARLNQMKYIISNIENLAGAFHDLKNKMIAAAGFYRMLVRAGKLAEREETATRTTIERRVEATMNSLKESQIKITELQGHLPPATSVRSTLILSNVNLAAALIQASNQPELSNIYNYYLGGGIPTAEERALISGSFESMNAFSELSTLTGDLESVYYQTNRIFSAIITHLNGLLPQLEEYAALPLDEIKRLAGDEQEDAKTRERARIILDAVSKIPREIDNLNAILEDVAAVEELKETDLQQLVADALEEVRGECLARGITLELKAADPGKPMFIRTKPAALKNFVITELIRNAVKYMPADKDVKNIKIWAELKNGSVLLYIQDTGRGMSAEFVQTQLFSAIGAMEEITGEDASNISRSGYGLYSARQFMRDIGGDLYVDNEHTAPGRGSTFVIRHPLALEAPIGTSAAPGLDLTAAVRSLGQAITNAVSPAQDIAPETVSGKAIILYADDILERGAAGDLAHTLSSTQALDNSTIVIYGRNPVRARLLEKIISTAAEDKNINVIKVEPDDLRGYNGFEQINSTYPNEAKELELLLNRLASHHKITSANILGAIKGVTNETSLQSIKELSFERHLPVVSFEDDKGIYSFRNALAELIAITTDVTPPANKAWYRILKPISKEDIEKAYQDYRRAIEVAFNA